jgi:hypothetical protein
MIGVCLDDPLLQIIVNWSFSGCWKSCANINPDRPSMKAAATTASVINTACGNNRDR